MAAGLSNFAPDMSVPDFRADTRRSAYALPRRPEITPSEGPTKV